MTEQVLRPHAEDEYAAELAALAKGDDKPRPPAWNMSPSAVVTYLLGGTAADGTEITPKYIGPRRLVEVAVATLATDRALLLLGVPGTAKTWMSEHLAAAISGDSTLLVQGTAGTAEAPDASTTVGARQVSWSVRTTYPPVAARTEVTVVPVSTGAADSLA